jgi:hypothetical protein
VALGKIEVEENNLDGARKMISDYTATHDKDPFAL